MQGTKILGLEQAIRFMQTVGTDREIKTAMRSGMRKASKVVAARAKQLVPKDSGNLRRSIGSVNARDKNNFPAVITGARKAKDGWYAHFVEFGTSGIVQKPTKGRYKKGQRYRSDQSPKPFMRPAIDEKQNEAMAIVGIEVGNAFGKKMQRMLR
jgi:HK97 gp10 family phage protein